MANRNFKPIIKGDPIMINENLPNTLGDVDDYSDEEILKQEEDDLTSPEEVSFIVPVIEETKDKVILNKVRPKTTHRVSIGGEWYQFISGEITSVPENVKRILTEGNDLLPL